jgi:hypothetical protein
MDIPAHLELFPLTISCSVSCVLFVHAYFTGTFLDFVDTSIVVLSGTISIANTAEFNGGTNRPCHLIGAKVCAVNHFGVGEDLACTTSNEFGL